VLFLEIIIPQFKELLAARKEAKESSIKLEVLKKNLDVLTNIDEKTLDSQLKTLSLVLPSNKDFVGILNSVYSSAQKAGVSLGGFSLAIGDPYLSKSENSNNFPVVRLSIPINADVATANNFIKIISKTAPLSEAYSIKVGNAFSTINLSFYYKPLDVSSYSQSVRVNPISQKGLTLVDQLSKFDNISLPSIPPISTATSSAAQ
jgi:hypothetical protein